MAWPRVPNTAADQITAALVAAFPDRAVSYTHDTIGFELACGDVTVAAADAAADARPNRSPDLGLEPAPKKVGGSVSTRTATHPDAFCG